MSLLAVQPHAFFTHVSELRWAHEQVDSWIDNLASQCLAGLMSLINERVFMIRCSCYKGSYTCRQRCKWIFSNAGVLSRQGPWQASQDVLCHLGD